MEGLKAVRDAFGEELRAAGTAAGVERIRVKYLGKKGVLTERLKLLSGLSAEEKKSLGRELNDLKALMTAEIFAKDALFKEDELKRKLLSESLDFTLPGRFTASGRRHPITQCLNEITDIFAAMGFGIEEGPEVETDYYNFEALNFPKEHPARDMQDTFFITENVVLRTHTSPVQIRVMERKQPPLRVIVPGKVYRCDADVSHTPMFHQVEGLMVGEDVSFGHLKGVLEAFIHGIFGPGIPVRFRPSFFPFTEPSAEADMGCIFCEGRGCRLCKGTGWIEILGAGMVNPKVFENVGYDPDIYSGFAFGMGVERIAMLKYQIDDIRLFFESDLRFLSQF